MLYGQIIAFLEVARSGTMRSAAERLYLSQPALSARIASLEKELEVRLFERHRTGMSLSIAGQAFLPHAVAAEQAILAGTRIAKDVAAGRDGEIMVGSGPAVSGYVMPELISQFQRRSPNVRVHFRAGTSQEIISLLEQGQLHLGLTMPLHNHDLPMRNVYRAKLSLVRAPNYPVERRHLDRVTLVLTARPNTYYRFAQDLFRDLEVEPRHVIEVDGVETAKKMVLHGVGVALLPSTASAIEVDTGDLVEIPLPGLPVFRNTALVESKQAGDWPPLEIFRNLISNIPSLVPGTYPIAD
jgi:DNA-binding transcriptional LysR family regulator